MKCKFDLSFLSSKLTEEEIQVVNGFLKSSNYEYSIPIDLVSNNEIIILLPVDKGGINNWGNIDQVKRFKAYYSDENIVSIELVE